MTRIHLAADHGGYELGRALRARADAAGFDTVWHGADELDPGDDYPAYAIRVGRAVVTDQDAGVDAFGVVVVGESAGGIVAANKVNGARAVLSTSLRGTVSARAVVDANVLVIDGVAFPESAWLNLYAFVTSPMEQTVERGRQILQIEEYENAGTIEGWAVQLEPEQIAVRHGYPEGKRMTRAALYDRLGGPEVLYVAEFPDEEPAPGQVAVRVRAAGINPFDGKVRSGFIPMPSPFPRRIGSDVAGTVVAVGDGAAYWDGTPVAVGDEVLGRAAGAVADRAVADAGELTLRPDSVPADVAAGLNVPGLTAVSCLVTVPVDESDTVLVGGATGAVGLVVCQLALAGGARVVGTASERHHPLLRSLGVEPVAYGEGLSERLSAFPPITAVVDCHGREALDAGLGVGVPAGRMVAIAAYAAIDELGVHNAERDARTAENLAGLVERVAAGRLVLPVAARFPLDEVAAAFAALESSHAPGKIVVVP